MSCSGYFAYSYFSAALGFCEAGYTGFAQKIYNCKGCYGRIQKRNFHKHKKVCAENKSSSAKVNKFLNFDLNDDDFYKDVLGSMKRGLDKNIMESDIIYRFGKYLWEVKGFRKVRFVRGQLRDSYRLLEKIRKDTGDLQLTWSELVHVSQVECLLKNIKELVQFEKKGKGVTMEAPSTAKRLIRVTNDIADFFLTEYCRKEECAKIDDTSIFKAF